MISSTKLFNPLTGIDLRTIISADLDEMKAKLAESPTFQEHLTFPLVTYRVRVEVDSYPMDKPVVVEIVKTLGDTQETAPDALRTIHDIPNLVPELQSDTGTIAEVPRKTAVRVSVGKGTQPRGRPAKVAAKADSSDSLLDDDGKPVKVNKF